MPRQRNWEGEEEKDRQDSLEFFVSLAYSGQIYTQFSSLLTFQGCFQREIAAQMSDESDDCTFVLNVTCLFWIIRVIHLFGLLKGMVFKLKIAHI